MLLSAELQRHISDAASQKEGYAPRDGKAALGRDACAQDPRCVSGECRNGTRAWLSGSGRTDVVQNEPLVVRRCEE